MNRHLGRQGQAAQRLWFLHADIHSLPEHAATVSSEAINHSGEYCAFVERGPPAQYALKARRDHADCCRRPFCAANQTAGL
jgi:hypothetical protein